MSDTNLINIQHELEAQALTDGITRYHNSIHEETDAAPGKALLQRTLVSYSTAIEAVCLAVTEGKAARGRPQVYGAYFAMFEPATMAYIAARRIINGCTKGDAQASVALNIGSLLEEHLGMVGLAETDAALVSTLDRRLKKQQGHRRRQVVRQVLRQKSAKGLSWSDGDKLKVGNKLLEIFIEDTGLAQVRLVSSGRKTTYHLEPTPATQEWLDQMHGRCELLHPKHLPMVVPPTPWTNPKAGGYLNNKVAKVDMVRTRSREWIDELFSTDMPEVYKALNTIQATPWRINGSVLAVLRELRETGGTLGGLPSRDPEPLPARPYDVPADAAVDSLSEEQQATLKAWKGRAAETHSLNAKMASQRVALDAKLSLANQFADFEAIYFPHNLDFRGRIYAIPTGISPQGDDVAKALLQFANGKPIGTEGGYWLAVQAANVWGQDKLPLDERVQWVVDNSELIIDSATDPLDGRRFWVDADEPWQALAVAYEWAGFMKHGDAWVSHQAVAMDGSCSGLQHFSAMLRDPVGGAAVNLIPSDECADIYTRVADAVELCLDHPTDGNIALADAWRGRVTRKIVKQPTMTFAYSVTSRGMRDQIMDALKKLDKGDKHLPEGVENFEAANWLAPIVEQCIRQTVVAASEGMKWLQQASKVTSKVGMPLRWTTPVGLPVLQDRRQSRSVKHNVWFAGSRVQFKLSHTESTIDSKGQSSSIAPNYIHSMDAAHLMLTVLASQEEGITDFAMIHDSFGAHACDTGMLNAVLRDEFVAMYEADQLAVFQETLEQQLEDESAEDSVIPPRPRVGSLELDGVRESDFFFS